MCLQQKQGGAGTEDGDGDALLKGPGSVTDTVHGKMHKCEAT